MSNTHMEEERKKLRVIASRDPDGDEWRTSPPTETDHEALRRWVVQFYGEALWARYRAGAWESTPDV